MIKYFLYHFLQVALLSGPPGLGKTTLAHVIARHAGYNVVEINARYFPYPTVFEKEFIIFQQKCYF